MVDVPLTEIFLNTKVHFIRQLIIEFLAELLKDNIVFFVWHSNDVIIMAARTFCRFAPMYAMVHIATFLAENNLVDSTHPYNLIFILYVIYTTFYLCLQG